MNTPGPRGLLPDGYADVGNPIQRAASASSPPDNGNGAGSARMGSLERGPVSLSVFARYEIANT